MFNIRNNIFPRKITDISACVLLITAIPATYMFEVYVVLPSIYGLWTFAHWLNVLFGTFLIFQVTTNFVALVMVDTSIKHQMLAVPTDESKAKSWRFCSVCETMVPPRSWHCRVCRTCILKRVHHCIFAGCCVGHKNHRFFCVFLFYMFISTTYTTVHNSIFFYSSDEFYKLATLVKMICPMLMFVLDNSLANIYIFIFDINLFCMLFALVTLSYHLRLILRGQVCHEYETRNNNSTKYNLGFKKNLLLVFGEKWMLAFLSPFFKSKLYMNGINWELYEQSSPKNK